MKIQCPCCNGAGVITLKPEPPVRLSPTEAKIYTIVQKCGKYGISGEGLRDRLYASRYDGGPESTSTMNVQIMHINRKLAAANISHRLRSDRRGRGAMYRLYDVV